MPTTSYGPREDGPRYDFSAPTVQAWAVRGLSIVVFLGTLALPWLATWQGVLRFEGVERQVMKPEVVQYRPELVLLPEGEFTMGSPESEDGRYDDETQHKAEVASFYLCRTEVTVAQWRAVMNSNPSDSTYGGDDGHPVQRVSWNKACEFMNKLTARENEVRAQQDMVALTLCYEANGDSWVWEDRACTGFRLPTEAEWEYAARAGTETAYSFGDDEKDICRHGNIADELAKKIHGDWYWTIDCNDKAANLASVGSYQANPWGLFDMHGNVWEWVYDWYDEKYPDMAQRGYSGPGGGKFRVLRGGSFWGVPETARSAHRHGDEPTNEYWNVGLRCARGVSELGPSAF